MCDSGIAHEESQQDERTRWLYPISNPVDSTVSKAAQNEHSKQGNSERSLIGGRYNEKVSRPQALSEEDDPKSQRSE